LDSIQILIESFHGHQRTGLIRLAYNSEKYLYLLFKHGEVFNTYLVIKDSQELLSAERWMEWVNSAGDAYAKVIPLSAFGLFVSKLLIQSVDGTKETFLQPNQLSEYFVSLGETNQLCLSQLNWDNAMGAVFFSGVDKTSHSLFVADETILDEPGVNRIFSKWDEPHCIVTTFVPDLSNAAWQEYYLRKSFAEICNRMIGRFEIMTGRSLIDSLVRLIAIFASRNNLDINILSRKLIDHEVFSSPEDAAQNYRKILKEMFSHFSVIVGTRLLASTLREIVMSFPDHERKIIRTFELFPEGYLYD